MREIVRSTAFKRDVKRLQRQRKEMGALVEIFNVLARGVVMPSHHLDRALKGNWSGYREVHLESDWLLIYKIAGGTVFLVRTGSHSELLQR